MDKPKLAPHLIVRGGLAAIKFYEDAFDAEVECVFMAEDGKRVMHAELEINDGTIYLCDDFRADGTGAVVSEKAGCESGVMIHLQFKKPKHVDAIIQQAADHGAEVVMPAEDAFWGDRYGQIRDPFGHVWTFGAALKKHHQVPPEMPPQEEKKPPKGRARGSKK